MGKMAERRVALGFSQEIPPEAGCKPALRHLQPPVPPFCPAAPKQGRVLTFRRAVAVESRTDLRIGLTASIGTAAPAGTRLLILAGALLAFAVFALALRSLRPDGEEGTV